MSEKLKPCPFCQRRAEHYSFCWKKHTVRCHYCLADCGEHDTPERAAFVWNTRPAEDKKNYDLKALNFIYNKQAEAWENEIERLKAESTRFKRALHNLKEDCTRRKHFAVSDEEKLFLYETISHIEAELDFNTDTGKRGEDE